MTAATSVPMQAASRSAARIRVLVVEDSPDHQLLMVRRLTRAGLDVQAAGTFDGALELVDEVDVVLLDYRLPGATGMDVLEAIKQRERPPSVVMVTGLGSTDVAVEAMRAGAIDYVTKHHGYLDELPDVVRRAWTRHDLTMRASELQRLALLVSSTVDRDRLFHEVVSGARRLLRARTAALLLAHDGEVHLATYLGPRPPGAEAALARGSRAIRHDTGPVVDDDGALVPLRRGDGRAVGLLALWRPGERVTDEELQLARAFAGFAGIALRNLRQRELEQDLVHELRQTVDARRDFVASISHELRTPLTSIAGFASTLTEHWEQLDDDDRLDLLGRITRNATDLQGLVDELIDLAAMDRGVAPRVETKPLPLGAHVRRVADDLGELLAEHDLRTELPAVEVLADEVLLRRVLVNLLTNAVKFSQPGTCVVLRARPDGDVVRVEVEDQGIGLDPRAAKHVFDPFFRVETSVANAVRGSGIGLALVDEYVRTMGGTVGVRSEPGVGSTFWFTVPVAGD